MIKTSARLFLASVAAGCLITLSSGPAFAQPHVDWAYDFMDNATVNDYGTPCDIDWSTYVGTTQGACFLTQMLMKAHGLTGADFTTMWGSASPDSSAYYDAIVTGSYFTQRTTATAIQPGDIMAIDNTVTYGGHTMIITMSAVEIMPQITPIYSGTKQWKVAVVDSTSTAHGCTDSRFIGTCVPLAGVTDPGVGEGLIRLYTDSITGALLGYTWSITKSTTSYFSPITRPYAIGTFVGP